MCGVLCFVGFLFLLNLSKLLEEFCPHLAVCVLWHALFANTARAAVLGWLSSVLPISAEGCCPFRPLGDE